MSADAARALAYKGMERDLGCVAVEQAAPSQAPLPLNPSLLPAEQPLCPRCSSGLYPMRQNARGDSLFECLKCATDGDGYQAIFRLSPPRWEFHPAATAQQKSAWRAPVRQKDLDAVKERTLEGKIPEPAEKPQAAWPESNPEHTVKPPKRQRRAKIAKDTTA